MNKKGGPIAVAILVFFTLFILMTTLFYVSAKKNPLDQSLQETNFIDFIYSREDVVNFYVQDLVDRSLKNSKSEEEFISELNRLVELYKYPPLSETYVVEEFETLQPQFNLDNLEVKKTPEGEIEFFNLTLDIELELYRKFNLDLSPLHKSSYYSVEYKYKKSFIGKI
jgi:hypothetical protein